MAGEGAMPRDVDIEVRVLQMEGAAVAHACSLCGVPFVSIRTLSDMADDNEETTYTFNEETAAHLSGAIMLAIVRAQ